MLLHIPEPSAPLDNNDNIARIPRLPHSAVKAIEAVALSPELIPCLSEVVFLN